MKPLIWIVVLAATVSGALTACQSSQGGLASAIERSQRVTDTSGLDSSDASVRIENTRFADMVVYVISEGGMRLRIGMANGNNDTVLRIPPTVVMSGADLRFVLRPIGGGNEEVSDKIFVVPGDEVVLTLTP